MVDKYVETPMSKRAKVVYKKGLSLEYSEEDKQAFCSTNGDFDIGRLVEEFVALECLDDFLPLCCRLNLTEQDVDSVLKEYHKVFWSDKKWASSGFGSSAVAISYPHTCEFFGISPSGDFSINENH